MTKTNPSDYRRWDRFELTYSIWDYFPDLPVPEQVKAVAWAFDLWAKATELRFDRLPDRQAADIEIHWVDRPGRDAGWANPPPGSEGQQPSDGNIWLNSAYRWTFELRENGEEPIDYLTLVAHELGHSIGIGHYCMFGRGLMSSPYSGSIREVRPHEINCFRQLYGLGHDPDSCCTFFLDDADNTLDHCTQGEES